MHLTTKAWTSGWQTAAVTNSECNIRSVRADWQGCWGAATTTHSGDNDGQARLSNDCQVAADRSCQESVQSCALFLLLPSLDRRGEKGPEVDD